MAKKTAAALLLPVSSNAVIGPNAAAAPIAPHSATCAPVRRAAFRRT
jgi:hypothetical protein